MKVLMNSYLVSCRNCAGPKQYGDEANTCLTPSDETLHGKAELLMRSSGIGKGSIFPGKKIPSTRNKTEPSEETEEFTGRKNHRNKGRGRNQH